jgi:hypothetical protein
LKTECPKCGSANARFVQEGPDIVLKCLCGVNKVVQTTLDQMVITRSETGPNIKLPRVDTHLHRTLMAVYTLDEATSHEITQNLIESGQAYSVSDVTTYLTFLRIKGLVVQVVVRRGTAGGSSWTLTEAAEDLIGA